MFIGILNIEVIYVDKKVKNFIDEIIKMLFLISILSVAYVYSSLISYTSLERMTRLKLLIVMFTFTIVISTKIFMECLKKSKINKITE